MKNLQTYLKGASLVAEVAEGDQSQIAVKGLVDAFNETSDYLDGLPEEYDRSMYELRQAMKEIETIYSKRRATMKRITL